jgi:hypothetical protein
MKEGRTALEASIRRRSETEKKKSSEHKTAEEERQRWGLYNFNTS